jgi:hypothetical protein
VFFAVKRRLAIERNLRSLRKGKRPTMPRDGILREYWFAVVVDHATNAIFQQEDIEVDKETYGDLQEPKVGQ